MYNVYKIGDYGDSNENTAVHRRRSGEIAGEAYQGIIKLIYAYYIPVVYML
jgi:hypothetical protein